MASKKIRKSGNLSEWIRKQPLSMGPKAVVEAAAKAGFGRVDPTYVSKVRPMGGGRGRPRKVSAFQPRAAVDHGEEAMIRFLELAKALGKDRARRLLDLL